MSTVIKRPWRWPAPLIAAVLVGSSLTVMPAAAEPAAKPSLPELQQLTRVPGERASTKRNDPPPAESQLKTWRGAPGVAWPAPGSAEVEVPRAQGLSTARSAGAPAGEPAGSLPVRVSSPMVPGAANRSARTAVDAPSVKVKVDLLDRATATKAGVGNGLVLGVKRTDGGAEAAPVSVELDYSAFKNAYGGGWGSRLQFVTMPECAVTTPQLPACQTRTPVEMRNDSGTGKLTATVQPAAAGVAGLQARTAGAPAQGMLLAATPSASGPNGTYKATSLSASGSWQAGGAAGDFSWSYPLELPGSLGGPAPSLALGYSSASIDGRTSASLQQSSWVGDGWDLGSNFIERTWVPCSQDKKDGSGFNNPKDDTGDLCHGAPMMTMSLNGGSTPLVQDDVTKVWRPAKDDGSRIELITGAQDLNGDKEGVHWRVTNPQGVQFWFGLNKVPGWQPGKPVTNSAWLVPIYNNQPGEPCYQPDFADSACDRAWRWNLDYVVDPRGNAMTYWYNKEVNHYGANFKFAGGSTNRAYDRGGWLDHVSYGLRGDNLFTNAPAQVDFTVAERCLTSPTFDCAEDKLKPEVDWNIAKMWPDTPGDQLCAANEECKARFTPTFFTRKRLTEINTKVWTGAAYQPVDTWALTQDFPMTGDGTDYPLWLASIQRTGKNGTPITLPPVTFRGRQLPNRVDKDGDALPPYLRYRIENIDTETGSIVSVKFKDTECSAVDPVKLPTAAESNALRCYPVIQEIPDPTDPDRKRKLYVTDYFHKHVVERVQEQDAIAGTPTRVTSYDYLGAPAWAYDEENELTEPKTRTWSQWRGYERVRTLIGQAPDRRTQTETLFFRGLDGDRASPTSDARRSVKVKDSENGEIADHKLYAGQTREVLVYDGEGGPLQAATTYTPWLSGPTATRVRTNETPPLQAYVQQTTKTASRVLLTDGRGWRRTATESTFNARGFIETTSSLGDIADANDDSCTRYWYAPDETKWMIDRQSRIESVAKACDAQNVQRPEDVTSDAKMFYDGVGNLERTESLSDYVGGQPVYVPDGTATFDAYGRPKSVTDVLGAVNSTEYFPAAGQIPTKTTITNPLGHRQSVETDPGRGATLAQEDANKRRSVMRYDALGRLVKAWSPDRNPDQKSADAEFSYTVRRDGPVVITNKNLLDDGSYRTSYDIYDGSLRIRQTQMEALGGGRMVTDTFYNSLGQIWKSNGGYYAEGAPEGAMFAPLDTKVPASTLTEYNSTGQPTVQISRKFGVETSRTTTTYGGDFVTVDPPTGETPTKAILDAVGRKTELQFFKGTEPTGAHDTTRYGYNRRGQLSSVVDEAGNTWGFEYDLRGRQVKVTDPDKGTSTMTYGAGDRLATTTDARGKTVAPEYDVLGRVKATHEGSITGPKLTESVFDTLPNALGLPVSSTRFVNGNAYKQEITGYDTEYRPKGTKITIPPSEGKLAKTYTFSSTYSETNGLPETSTFPAVAGLPIEDITMSYNRYELPTVMGVNGDTFVDRVDYSPLGDVLRTHAGPAPKQVWSTYEYDEQTRRPTRTVNDRETSPSRINDARTEYDTVGNITKITDAFGSNPTPSTTDTQCFVYDYMRRMTDAWSATDDCATKPGQVGPNGGRPNVGGPDAYWSSYSFDAAGNRKTETKHDPAGAAGQDVNRTYTYGTPGTAGANYLKKVDTTGPGGSRTESYTYDAAGNTATRTIQGDTQNLEWDVEGHVSKVTEGAKVTSFLYDAGGERLIKRDPSGTTLYLPGTEVQLDPAGNIVKGTRYYAHPAGPTLVKTVENGQTKRSYLMADQNGTANTAVDADTQEVTRRKFTPFGDVRGVKPSIWPGNQGFVGGTNDESTGLVHLGAREYDPAVGRFLSVDPVVDYSEPKQMNAYVYAANSPVTFSDPSGLAISMPVMPIKDFSDAELAWAHWAKGRSLIDVAMEAAMSALKDASGYNDIRDCVSGDGWACAGIAADAAFSLFGGGGAAKRIAKGLKRAYDAMKKWAGVVQRALDIIARAERYQQAMAKYAEDLAAWQREQEAAAAAARKLEEEAAAAKKAQEEAAAAAAKKADEAAASAAKQGKESTTQAKKADGDGKSSKSTESKKAERPAKKKEESPQDNCSRNGGGNSFVPGTPILMGDGSAKPIEDVLIGDEVLATDSSTGEQKPEPVVALIDGVGAKDLVRLTVEDGERGAEIITATAGHPFWVPELGKWVKAADLEVGQRLRTSSGTWIPISAVEKWSAYQRVHNLTVADLHTYHPLAGQTPLLAHNCGGLSSTWQPERNATSIDRQSPGHGFSGVFDTSTGRFEARLSDGAPGAILPRRGGHAILNTRFFDDSRTTVGFTAIVQEGGSLAVTWLSRGVTGRNFPGSGGMASTSQRQAILAALRSATGRTVTG
ncbi:RHS repeat-associated core domain-containing protein [Embleya sp. NPDC056575]|uniref:RHS repeat-associated core domain-containing protein n=1 Tax=unclassified Embleya TaxID=2699296 RepID=UPI00368E7B16